MFGNVTLRPVTYSLSGNVTLCPVTYSLSEAPRPGEHRAGASSERSEDARRTEEPTATRMERDVLEDIPTTQRPLQGLCWRPRLAADCLPITTDGSVQARFLSEGVPEGVPEGVGKVSLEGVGKVSRKVSRKVSL